MCSDEVAKNYTSDTKRGSLYLYPKLMLANLRILIFSGDTDGAVPLNGTLAWINNLNLAVVSPWRSWLLNSLVGGYTVKYQGLTLVTVKGVGHMVPQWARDRALYMFTKYLNNQDI